jgi:hypothetical protein
VHYLHAAQNGCGVSLRSPFVWDRKRGQPPFGVGAFERGKVGRAVECCTKNHSRFYLYTQTDTPKPLRVQLSQRAGKERANININIYTLTLSVKMDKAQETIREQQLQIDAMQVRVCV